MWLELAMQDLAAFDLQNIQHNRGLEHKELENYIWSYIQLNALCDCKTYLIDSNQTLRFTKLSEY